MISLFPHDDVFRVTIRGPMAEFLGVGQNGLLIGVRGDKNFLEGLVMLEDGRLTYLADTDFTVNWRYDPERDEFVNLDFREQT